MSLDAMDISIYVQVLLHNHKHYIFCNFHDKLCKPDVGYFLVMREVILFEKVTIRYCVIHESYKREVHPSPPSCLWNLHLHQARLEEGEFNAQELGKRSEGFWQDGSSQTSVV